MADLALWFENDEILQKAKEKHEAEEAAKGKKPKKPRKSRGSARARSSSSSSSSSASTGDSAATPSDPEAETSASEETQKQTYRAAVRRPFLTWRTEELRNLAGGAEVPEELSSDKLHVRT